MIVRPLKDGDMVPISNVDQLIDGKEAVAQVIDLRLSMNYGEWWEDETLGFRVPEFLIGNARSGDIELLSKYIASYVSNTQGVRAVVDMTANYSDHKIVFYCAVVTTDGDADTVEVDLNGVL